MKILIAYDGTIHAKKALSYGLAKVKDESGSVLVVQVFDPRLFIDYDAGPGAEGLARAEAARMHKDAGEILQKQGEGIESRMVFEEGDTATIIERYAVEEHVDLVLVPALLKNMAKSLTRPAYVIPGTVLVPVDNTDTAFLNLETIVREARGTGSRIHLAGIVPLHLYSRDEKEELDKVASETKSAVRRLSAVLREQGLEAAEELRFGYPDEEILRSAEAHGASLILLPSGGKTPSELSKAAAILLEEPEQIKRPVFLFPQHEAI